MGGRSIPVDCPHGGVLDWGDFGPDPDGSVGTCQVCNPTPTPDPEVAELHAAVDNLAARVADLAAAIDRVERRVRDTLEGDGR